MRSADHFFTVLMRENERGCARLGLAVGKKQVPGAVARNRIKRLVRESFRHHSTALEGFDVVVLCRSSCRASNEELRRSLAKHWQRLAKRRSRGDRAARDTLT